MLPDSAEPLRTRPIHRRGGPPGEIAEETGANPAERDPDLMQIRGSISSSLTVSHMQ